MANIRILNRSFAGGEISPEMFGRIDDIKFATGTALMRNFIPLPHGPAANRPGFQFVREVKDSTKKVRLIPFTFSSTQTFAIEMGAGYFRFHSMGGTVLSAGVPYEIANPFTEDELFSVHYVQSADVVTLVHPNHAPMELRRLGATNWQLITISFGPTLSPPSSVSVAAAGAPSSGLISYKYVVTAVVDTPVNESIASSVGSVNNNLYTTGATNTISWPAVTGASRYKVYKYSGGVYGYIGQTTSLSIIDDNIAADISETPPIYDVQFNATGDYPAAVTYFEQRRVFAGTINKPQNIWMTRSGTESNMSYSLPVRDDDRISVRVAAREANTIAHAIPLGNLVFLTSSAEWRVTSINTDAITPTSISVRPQSYIGANQAQPLLVNNNLIYAAARGGHVREMAYNDNAGGYITGDLSLRSPHLFDNLDIADMTYAKAPQPICWFVSSNGKLLGLTYVPEQQVGAWHQHDTVDGVFESCTAIAEGTEDVLYVVVKRTINGATKRYVERMASRQFVNQEDAFFVDSGLTYNGAETSSISGLSHLEGETVNILADGAVHPRRVVTSGAIELDNPASVVHVGLPITSDVQTLPMAANIDSGYGQGRSKNVNKVWLRVYRSSGIFVGPSSDRLTEAKQRTTENYGQPPALKSDEIEVLITPTWDQGGQVFIRQADPLPLTLVSMTMEVAIGS
jgi:hypothetical protein